MENNKLDDLSYSGLVNKIQNDKNVGREVLIDIVREFEENKLIRADLQKQLKQVQCRMDMLSTAQVHIFDHLRLSTPLAIIIPEGFIVISKDSMSIETNVL